VDDPVAKLMHMGKETCRKLADLHTAAQQANMELDLEPQLACVDKVSAPVLLAMQTLPGRAVCQTGAALS
jgi:hypothetical protein